MNTVVKTGLALFAAGLLAWLVAAGLLTGFVLAVWFATEVN